MMDSEKSLPEITIKAVALGIILSVVLAAANAYLRTRGTPENGPLMKDAVLMKLGEAYYLNGDFGLARIQFMEVADRESAAAYREVALFFAAKSALQINVNARADGLKILQEVAFRNDLMLAVVGK